MNRGDTKDIKQMVREMKEEFDTVQIIQWNPFLPAKILELFNKHTYCLYHEYHFCCYGLERSCWIDVEAEEGGWLFLNYEKDGVLDVAGIRSHLLGNMIDMAKGSNGDDIRIIIGERSDEAEMLIIDPTGDNSRFFFTDNED